MDRRAYVEYVLDLTLKEFIEELKKVYYESNIKDNHLIFIDVGGPVFTIEKICAYLYLKMGIIDEDVRFKFYVLYKIYNILNNEEYVNNIFSLRKKYIEEKYDYSKESLLEKIDKMKIKVMAEFSDFI